MKIYITTLILVAVAMLGCKRTNKQTLDDDQQGVEVFDSTYYWMLNRAYADKDTSQLRSFFKNG